MKTPKTSKLKKILLFLAVFGGASVLFIPLMSRFFLTGYALKKAEEILQLKLEISSAELQILSGGVVVRGLKVYHPTRPHETVMEMGRAALKIHPLPLIMGDMAGIELEMDKPKLVYATTRSGAWELSDKVPLFRRGKGEKRLPVNVDSIIMKDGEVEYRDGRVGMTTRVNDIDIKVSHVRLPTKDDPLPARFKMTFEINDKADYKMEGRADFLSPKVSFDAEASLSGLPLPPYAPYYDRGLPVRITRGSMSMASHAKCENDYLKAPAHVVISGLQVEPKQAKIFGFAANTVVDSLKDKDGQVELDMMISGNIRNPQFHVMTDLTAGFVKELSHGLVMAVPNEIGNAVKEGASSGLDKLKGLFGR